jgi:hypothetical protein
VASFADEGGVVLYFLGNGAALQGERILIASH